MVVRNFIITLLVLAACITVRAAQPVIALKFRSHSPAFAIWQEKSRTGAIELLSTVIGTHTTRPIVSDATLTSIRKREQSQALRKQTESMSESLARLCGIEVPQSADAVLLAGKLRSLPDVEYVEVLPKRTFSAEPNDPFLAQQYHLGIVHAFEAWAELDSTAAPIILGIVDTGVDYLHEDLAPVIYINPGEDGTDDQGLNKRSNGKDDDNNGYIDDWHGWDFVSSTSPDGRDNDPMPGNSHGTHVAGIAGAAVNNGIGIAGTAIGIRLMPVKIGNDLGSNSVENSYDGLLFAAATGADVINCSWGGEASSESEAEVVLAAQKLGAVIVAAAGNSGKNTAFYPAAYPGVMSVAASDERDNKASFSNYHGSVDICAPGLSIYSTFPSNTYGYDSGTSMASPVGAGLACLVRNKFPQYSPEQVVAHIKATTDNIDSINLGFEGKIGTGRVNFLKSLTTLSAKSAELSSYQLTDESGDGVFEPGERVTVALTVRNILSPLQDATIGITPDSPYTIESSPASIHLGAMATGEELSPAESYVFTIPKDIPPNYLMEFTVTIKDDSNAMRGYFALTVNPTYKTMSANNLSVTFNSRGNIGYNDYPNNEQGKGFRYKNGKDMLYESALMVGTSAERLSDVARSSNQDQQSASFHTDSVFTLTNPGVVSRLDGHAVFSDANATGDAGVRVKQNCYQFSDAGHENFVIVTYDITNITGSTLNDLHAGLYFDWDIGAAGSNNIVKFEENEGYGYALRADDSTLPYAAAALLTDQPLNFFAMDNGGNTAANPGVYDGFTRKEKWQTISSGLGRLTSSRTDASMVIAAGPMALEAGQTVRVAYALGAAENLADLTSVINSARTVAAEKQLASGFRFTPLPQSATLMSITPNAVGTGNTCTVEIYLPVESDASLVFVNMLGQVVSDLPLGKLNADIHRIPINVSGLAQGLYFAQLKTNESLNALPFTIVR